MSDDRRLVRPLTRLVLIALVGRALAGCGNGPADEIASESEALTVCPGGSTLQGIDVSAYQTTNWSSVKSSGRTFGIIKATEGTGYTNGELAHDWAASKGAGVIRGAYHFFHPSISGSAQADYFVSVLNANGGLQPGDLPPMLDWEVTDGVSNATNISEAQAWLNRVQSLTGVKPYIYTYPSYWNSLGNPNFTSYPLNIANYGPSCPDVPAPWSNWIMWQYSSTTSVPGVSPSGSDVDEFNGTLADLLAWTKGTPYAASWHNQSYPTDLTSGDRTAAWLEYTNQGSSGWDGNTRVGTVDPRDRSSAFADATWLGPGRPASVDAATAPGAIGRFSFTLHAPDVMKDTVFKEDWGLVQEGVTWFGPPDGAVWFQLTVHPRYSATFDGQSYPMDMTSGEVAAASIALTNSGTTVWDPSATRLGTTSPNDRASAFYDAVSWINPSRPTGVAATTAPAAIGRFNFTLQAPQVSSTTTYIEHWGVVQEGVSWVQTPDVWFQLTVHPATPGPSPTEPAVAGGGQGASVHGGCGVAPGHASSSDDGALALAGLLLLGVLLGRGRRSRHA